MNPYARTINRNKNKVECPSHIKSQIHLGNSCVQKWVYKFVWNESMRHFSAQSILTILNEFSSRNFDQHLEMIWYRAPKIHQNRLWDKAGWEFSQCYYHQQTRPTTLGKVDDFARNALFRFSEQDSQRSCWEKSQKKPSIYFTNSTLSLRLPSQE